MSANMLGDLIDELIHEADVAAAPAWNGAPLRFHSDYYSPEQLDAAFRRYIFENGRLGCIPNSHMWHRTLTGGTMHLEHHDLHTFTVDLRCDRWAHGGSGISGQDIPPCSCIGDMLHQVICSRCEWHHITAGEGDAIAAWHDHAFPGWRDLPTLPEKLRGRMGGTTMTGKLRDWLEDNYPPEFLVDGAPIITDRGGVATRAVPGYSPLGGYDISTTHRTTAK